MKHKAKYCTNRVNPLFIMVTRNWKLYKNNYNHKNTNYTYLVKTEDLSDSGKMYFVLGWRIENGIALSMRLRYRLCITNDINQYIIYKLSNKYLPKMFDTMACNFLLQIINN